MINGNGICGLEIVIDGVALATNLKFINKKVGFCMYFIVGKYIE